MSILKLTIRILTFPFFLPLLAIECIGDYIIWAWEL